MPSPAPNPRLFRPMRLLAFLLAPLAAFAADKPNIILILADDLGYADLGCQGSKEVISPHMDSLAANGVRFTLPAGTSEQSIALPVDGQAIHVRFNLGDQTDDLRIRSIELHPAKGPANVADFGR